MGTPSMRIVCHVCGLPFPQLTCPRCSIRYCSPECYESHKLRCPVSFPPINVLDKLRLIQPDDEPQRLILDLSSKSRKQCQPLQIHIQNHLSEEAAKNMLYGPYLV